ncbi:FKBP-type peptidyl-prolyl cis-trans isomerase [Flavisericum labens]|uniref:FKBP-type peptidyl-prolyl cis-trans isomerase n=1 Tax=Flavisericum labens TaxID=3377112 RepID=UPI00387AE6BD
MNVKKFSVLVVFAVLGFVSCKKDDDSVEVPVIEIRDRAEQQDADMDSISKYLKSHYINLDELIADADSGVEDIVIVEVGENETVPDGYTSMEEAVGAAKTTTYAEIDYEYYELEIRKGGGDESPSFADTVQILYEGSLVLDDSVFDSKFVPDNNPLDLTGLIPGWSRIIPEFNTAESYTENGDGTINYFNSGLGVMILPSGLAYFSGSNIGIPSYSPLVFKFELINFDQNDHDGDGIPSYLEDVNENGELITAEGLADDDTDNDRLPNYADTDDDGDGIPTRDELKTETYTINQGDEEPVFDEKMEFVIGRVENDGVITIKTAKIVDSNNDGTGDYLDDSITVRNSND